MLCLKWHHYVENGDLFRDTGIPIAYWCILTAWPDVLPHHWVDVVSADDTLQTCGSSAVIDKGDFYNLHFINQNRPHCRFTYPLLRHVNKLCMCLHVLISKKSDVSDITKNMKES